MIPAATLNLLATAALLLAVGLWLMLPRGGRRGRAAGTVLVAVALGLFGSRLPWLGGWADQSVFLVLAGVTVVSAVATVTLCNPVYCAIWFGLTLLGTAGLFLYQGAQFLGVATVVVYAGAILVTFLFVLMLANPSGQAYYDRLSWEAFWSAGAGAAMLFLLTVSLADVWNEPRQQREGAGATAEAREASVLTEYHVATLGKHLFSTHLIAVEVAGTLLLVALVGAVAIVSQEKSAVARVRLSAEPVAPAESIVIQQRTSSPGQGDDVDE